MTAINRPAAPTATRHNRSMTRREFVASYREVRDAAPHSMAYPEIADAVARVNHRAMVVFNDALAADPLAHYAGRMLRAAAAALDADIPF